MKKTSIGLDIGSHTLKLIELAFVKGKPVLTNFARLSLIDKTLKEGILELVSCAGIANRRVNLGVQGPSVIVRYIQMPKMSDEEFKSSMRFEAEKYVPFSLNEVIIDHTILEKETNSNNMRVLLVAVKREYINNILELINETKLEIGLIDVDNLAIVNAFMNSKIREESTCAILNMGAKTTNLNIINKECIYFTRDIMKAGEELTHKIKERFNLDFKSSEALKIEPGDKIPSVKEALGPVLDKIIDEIRLSFDYFESQYEKNIERLYLSGGTSYLFNIIEVLKEGLGLEVLRWDPLAGMRISEEIDAEALKSVSSQLVVAVGLALRK